MARYAVIDQTGLVTNVIEWDGVVDFTPPIDHTVELTNEAGPGWTFDGSVFAAPIPPSRVEEPLTAEELANQMIRDGTMTQAKIDTIKATR
ncbi:MAG: hypothetical protein V3S69_01990 [Dehalococcoidales bacterium]